MQIWPQGDGQVTELKSHLLINHVKSLLCSLLDNQRIYMPSVVHHKDTVCLRGGQLGGGDINRERKEDLERGGGLEEVGENIEYTEEAAFNFVCFIYPYRALIESGLL